MSAPIVLFVVTTDPMKDGRTAEAIRIAAGVGTWRKAEVRLYLHGPAVRSLGEWVDELVDEDNFTRYLPILAELPGPIYVQAGAGELDDLGESPFTYEAVDDVGLQQLCREATYVLRF